MIVASFIAGILVGVLCCIIAAQITADRNMPALTAEPDIIDIKPILRLAQERAGRVICVIDEAAKFNENNGETWEQHRERLSREFSEMRHFAATLLTQINGIEPLLEPGQTGPLKQIIRQMERE